VAASGRDFTGLRVGVIGTGSSAIQSIPIIAQQASSLTVFQRTATWSVPAWNESCRRNICEPPRLTIPRSGPRPAPARPASIFLSILSRRWRRARRSAKRSTSRLGARRGLPFLGAHGDLLFEKAANDTIAEFARRKIRGIVKDPATAELCVRTTSSAASGSASIPVTSDPNLPHIKLVDVRTPIERFTAEGIEVGGVSTRSMRSSPPPALLQ
jgi:cyclohexanone monooxygenase